MRDKTLDRAQFSLKKMGCLSCSDLSLQEKKSKRVDRIGLDWIEKKTAGLEEKGCV